MYTFPPTTFVIDLCLYSSDTRKEVSTRVWGRKRAQRAHQACAPFCATTFQKSGLKHTAAADTQKDCFEKSTREERGGSEEAMTENESRTARLYSPPHADGEQPLTT